MARLTALLALLALLPAAASAEVSLSFYGGWQESPHSGVTVVPGDTVDGADVTAGWEGRSFEAPPYYGLRATWWRGPELGWGVDFTHAKVYADQETLDATGYDVLEFSDGINILTVNVYRRWQDAWGDFTPYVGGGIGVSIPHVELTDNGSETFGYQVTGPAVRGLAGASYPIADNWDLFGEYMFTYSQNEAELDDGGTLNTDIITNALNVGVSFNF